MEFELGPKLWKLIDGSDTYPVLDAAAKSDPNTPQNVILIKVHESALEEWGIQNRDAIRIILPTIVEPEFLMIRGCQSAKAVWDTLASNYRDTSLIHQCNVLEQLYTLRKTSDISIDIYISKFSKLYEEVKTFDIYIQIHEVFIIMQFLRSLPSEFVHFARSYDHVIKMTKLADVFGALRSEWDNRTGADAMTSTTKSPVALHVQTGGKKSRKSKSSQSTPPASSSSTASTSSKFCDFCK